MGKIETFKSRLNDLYRDVEAWVNGTFEVERKTQEITEESLGTYTVDELRIKDGEVIIATFIPIGENMIGSQGRVDIIGRVGKEVIVFMLKGGPSITLTIKEKDRPEDEGSAVVPGMTHYLYKNINVDGWYWIESRQLRRAYLLDKDILMKLISSVSDRIFAN